MKKIWYLSLLSIMSVLPFVGNAQSNNGVPINTVQTPSTATDQEDDIQLVFNRIASDQMVAYLNIDNGFTIKIKGYYSNSDNIRVILDNPSAKFKKAKLVRDRQGSMLDYILTPLVKSPLRVNVVEQIGSSTNMIKSFEVEVEELPKPTLYLGSFSDKKPIKVDKFLASDQMRLRVVVENKDFVIMEPEVVSFNIRVNDGVDIKVNGCYLPPSAIDLINSASNKCKLHITNLKARNAEGNTWDLNGTFTLVY